MKRKLLALIVPLALLSVLIGMALATATPVAATDNGTNPANPDKVYLELRPDLDETGMIKKGFVPTETYVGIFFGYSLPVWTPASSNETLYFEICVPDRWDGSSDILVHTVVVTSSNQTGNVYELEIAWDKVSPNIVEAIPTGAPNLVSAIRTVDSELTYACYLDWFTFDYDVEAEDPVAVDDNIAFRLRRFGDSDNLTSELIVIECSVLFARGDLLGDPEGGILEIIIELIEEGIVIGGESVALYLLALIFLPLGLTIAMFITRERMLGFPCVIMWAILGGFAYIESTTPWGDWQFYLFFASAFGMTIFCALAQYGLREKRDSIADEGLEKGDGGLIDESEKEHQSVFIDENEKPSKRTQAVRKRAADRRTRL